MTTKAQFGHLEQGVGIKQLVMTGRQRQIIATGFTLFVHLAT